jgi:hypothetical protein
VVSDDFATVASLLGMCKLRRLAWSGRASYRDAYSAVEKRANGDVLRKPSAEGSAARARAPTSVFAMMLWELGLVVMFTSRSCLALQPCLSH